MENDKKYDPISELLKYSFKLKVQLNRRSQAEELENLIDELLVNKDEETASFLSSILVLLNELKSPQAEDEESLVIYQDIKQ